MSQHPHRVPLSPPQTATSQPSSSAAAASQQRSAVTHKSHRLRTSPVPGEGSTFVPVVKFSQSFTQRNALRGIKPLYGTAPEDILQQRVEGDIVPIPRPPGGHGVDARAHGWTISITSSSHTDDDLQVEVQQHFEPATTSQPRTSILQQSTSAHRQGKLPVGAKPRVPSPKLPSASVPPIPILAHDRVVITPEDLKRLKTRCLSVLIIGVMFPPLWVLMGWGHALDAFLLPPGWATRYHQRQQINEIYTPYRTVASVLAGVVVLGTFVGIIVGGLALGGVIV